MEQQHLGEYLSKFCGSFYHDLLDDQNFAVYILLMRHFDKLVEAPLTAVDGSSNICDLWDKVTELYRIRYHFASTMSDLCWEHLPKLRRSPSMCKRGLMKVYG